MKRKRKHRQKSGTQIEKHNSNKKAQLKQKSTTQTKEAKPKQRSTTQTETHNSNKEAQRKQKSTTQTRLLPFA